MDDRLFRYYENELQYLWEQGEKFREAHPNSGRRLGLENREYVDPYVERLLEGFAFLAARVQLKIDDEFPRFTQHLLEAVLPDYLAPLPSMAVVQFKPKLDEGNLAKGSPFLVKRDTPIRSVHRSEKAIPIRLSTDCEYRTAHDVELWPIELIEASYLALSDDDASPTGSRLRDVAAGIRIRLRVVSDLTFDKLGQEAGRTLDALPLFLSSSSELAYRIHEELTLSENVVGITVAPTQASKHFVIYPSKDKPVVRTMGFEDKEALLPITRRSLSSHRLLKEYFAFPERFLFVELTNLKKAFQRCPHNQVDITIMLKRRIGRLEGAVSTANLRLFCTPAINLFPRRADNILLEQKSEHQVVVDKTRPTDFEVYSVTNLVGLDTENTPHSFLPLYGLRHKSSDSDSTAFYATHRKPSRDPKRERLRKTLRHYPGSEVFVSLVDKSEAPYSPKLVSLKVNTWCTNRDLPLELKELGQATFRTVSGEPVASVECLAGPSAPKPSHTEGRYVWRVINHLSLNYLTFTDLNKEKAGFALRDQLMLYAHAIREHTGEEVEGGATHIEKQIDGIRAVQTRATVDRLTGAGPISFGRGVEVIVTCDETAFTGTGPFLLGSVLAQFFARHSSINSYSKTVLRNVTDHELAKWPAITGTRQAL